MDDIMNHIRRFNIKKSFVLYMGVGLLLAFFLSATVGSACNSLHTLIIDRYWGKLDLVNMNESITYIPASPSEITLPDKILINICNFFLSFGVLIFFSICISVAALLFYRNKIKKPLTILVQAAEEISNNNLDFTVWYSDKDEFGLLCDSFEKMRQTLVVNNQKLWRVLEERKHLNSAFSHDLRTPITVAKGNSQLLLNYLPQGKLQKDQILSMIETIYNHINRLEEQTNTMSSLQKLEDIACNPQPINISFLILSIKQTIQTLIAERQPDITYELDNNTGLDTINGDSSFILEAIDNLLSNALRFAKSHIRISCCIISNELTITVLDDGPDFREQDLGQADIPFHSYNPTIDEIHFGVGLSIAKLLCEKHGGSLSIENKAGYGACVTCYFKITY